MSLTRREALTGLAGAAVAGAALSGCSRIADQFSNAPAKQSALTLADDEAVVRLNRFGYGPTPVSLAEFRKIGSEAWLKAQLNPEVEPVHLMMKLRSLEIFHHNPYDLRDFSEEKIVGQMQQAAILRAVYSPWQLRERLVDFWTNHFNIFAKKGLSAYRKPLDEREVIRKHALGSFPQMLLASARSSAMLVYLDQQASHKAQPNENYARELMELHTLGVRGGYSQQDVMEVARCFTGWSEERRFLRPKGSFRFIEELHDEGEKVVLGNKIPAGGGVADGEKVIEILAHHPATAKYIAHKLCRFFLGESGQSVEKKVAETYLRTKGDVCSMITDIYSADAVMVGDPVLKRPFDFAVSAMRAVDASSDGGAGIQGHLAKMGQPLYLWPMPDGYPDSTEAWSGALLARWNFAIDLVHNRIEGCAVDADRLQAQFSDKDLRAHVYYSTSESIATSAVEVKSDEDSYALYLASPEFQWR